MSKNIVLFSDGTGNGAAKRNKTNVWRLYDALDLHRPDQVAFYDDGVGSQEFLPFKLIGGAFGWGLARNVRELYKFLCRTYSSGDRIYLFGFSRGAYTVRMLAGMIDYCGLYQDYQDEAELEQACQDNYNSFRSRFKSGLLTRGIRIFTGRTDPLPTTCFPDIEFIGVWDTVDAYGLPSDELARICNWLIFPIRFPDFNLSPKVKKACHALSVDDERLTFHPVLWNESGEQTADRIEQVWFPGVHSDVGGGYPRYSLALLSLDWMISKVEARDPSPGAPGLHLIRRKREEYLRHSDWHAPQHDSRAMFAAYYRYKPRDITLLCNDYKNDIHIRLPRIHRSVMERIAGNMVPYAPALLPGRYRVVSTRGSQPLYELPEERRQRLQAMRPVRRIIALRRLLYYCFLVTSLLFATSPFFLGCLHADQCPPAPGLLSCLLGYVQELLPDILSPWLRTLRTSPVLLWSLIVLFILFSFLKNLAWKKNLQLATRGWDRVKGGPEKR